MESNICGKLQDSIVKPCGETSIVANKLTYTWVIKKYDVAHKNREAINNIASPVITLYNRYDKYEFQLKIVIRSATRKTVDNLISHYECIDSSIVTLVCPDVETKAIIRLYFVKKDGSEYDPLTRISSIVKYNGAVSHSGHDEVVENCLSDGNLTMKFEITFYNAIPNNESDSAVLEAATAFSKTSILDEYEELLNSAEFSDVTLVVGDKKFPAHKAILASRSPVFSAMFKHDMLENKENIVEITDVGPEIMAEVLRFIYAGKVKDVQLFGADLLVVADKYQLEALRLMCEGALMKNLNVDNVADILKIVDRYESCRRLRDSVMKFLTVNGKEIASLQNFEKIFQALSPALVIEVTKAIMKKS